MKPIPHTTLRAIIKRAPELALSLLVILDRAARNHSPLLSVNEANLLECGAYFTPELNAIEQSDPGDLIVHHLHEIGVLTGAYPGFDVNPAEFINHVKSLTEAEQISICVALHYMHHVQHANPANAEALRSRFNIIRNTEEKVV